MSETVDTSWIAPEARLREKLNALLRRQADLTNRLALAGGQRQALCNQILALDQAIATCRALVARQCACAGECGTSRCARAFGLAGGNDD
jgi:hypothetical protein